MLQPTFVSLLEKYTTDQGLIHKLWSEVERKHTGKNRHYHSLVHLEDLLIQLIEVKDLVENWDAILFTLYYHDIIYNAFKSNNESKSAELAVKRMKQLSVPNKTIERCHSHVIATKSHQHSTDMDTNYFTDADLSILGRDWDTYEQYYKNVRKEYAIFPSFVYNPGRRKVLNHFLDMDRIFKTDHFYEKYEKLAKLNIRKELEALS